ncbi:CGNR zinc finger domain-containing protein [Embleya sp. NPDC050493]|uniref:CGNR zinc finger domain-containing protein n=1 Tax=Embleya sp. NPDC050493 TaxID=3363989 RepID=UPI0037ABEB1E
MTAQAPLIAELANLVTPTWRGGSPARPAQGDELVTAFSAAAGERIAAALRDVPDAATRLTTLAVALRDALTAPTPAETAARINAMMSRYAARPYLVEDEDQPFHLHFHGSGETAVEALGGEFATALALVVDGYGSNRLGMCEARRCEGVYIDLTRNGSRRYCGPACTARAKTAAYRSRQ